VSIIQSAVMGDIVLMVNVGNNKKEESRNAKS